MDALAVFSRLRTCRLTIEMHGSNPFRSVGQASFAFHGDDASGYGPGYMVIADGVSGTTKASGVLARMLVAETLHALGKLRKLRKRATAPIKPAEFHACVEAARKKARKHTHRKGRLDSTLTAVFFDEISHTMLVYSIGDCKCILVRDGAVVFESDSLIYDFNVPAVVSSHDAINYDLSVDVQSCSYEAGDVCLVFSDGVHDNLFADEILQCISRVPSDGGEMAKATMNKARSMFAKKPEQPVDDQEAEKQEIKDTYIPFAVSAAGFCQNALAELKQNAAISQEEYDRFAAKCSSMPAAQVTRPMFAKEQRVRPLAFYTASNLLSFAGKQEGKRDDVTVCAAVLA